MKKILIMLLGAISLNAGFQDWLTMDSAKTGIVVATVPAIITIAPYALGIGLGQSLASSVYNGLGYWALQSEKNKIVDDIELKRAQYKTHKRMHESYIRDNKNMKTQIENNISILENKLNFANQMQRLTLNNQLSTLKNNKNRCLTALSNHTQVLADIDAESNQFESYIKTFNNDIANFRNKFYISIASASLCTSGIICFYMLQKK